MRYLTFLACLLACNANAFGELVTYEINHTVTTAEDLAKTLSVFGTITRETTLGEHDFLTLTANLTFSNNFNADTAVSLAAFDGALGTTRLTMNDVGGDLVVSAIGGADNDVIAFQTPNHPNDGTYQLFFGIGSNFTSVSVGMNYVEILDPATHFSGTLSTTQLDTNPFTLGTAAVPEPSSLLCFSLAGLCLTGFRRRKR